MDFSQIQGAIPPERYYEACITHHLVRLAEMRGRRLYPFSISQLREKACGFDFGYACRHGAEPRADAGRGGDGLGDPVRRVGRGGRLDRLLGGGKQMKQGDILGAYRSIDGGRIDLNLAGGLETDMAEATVFHEECHAWLSRTTALGVVQSMIEA